MKQPLRILIVDDSTLMRQFLRSVIATDTTLQVVGEATNGREAIEQTALLRPDVIIMDVRMPVMDGLETTEQLMAYHPTPILALTASLSHYDVNITFKMLEAGALDVIEKPALDDAGAVEQAKRDLIRRIKLLSRVRVVTHLRGRRRSAQWRAAEPAPATPASLVAHNNQPNDPTFAPPTAITSPSYVLTVIGASTGGPQVVRRILSQYTSPFPAAILVVQHIAEGFSAGLAEWLGSSIQLPTRLAAEGDRLMAGVVYVAPDSYDLIVRPGGRVHLSKRSLYVQRPAIDLAMQSAAEVFAERTIGVLLTGMGRDGAVGLQAIKGHGGFTIAQDEASCAIYGMPRAAVQLGAVDLVLPPDEISGAIRSQCEQVVGNL
jgi:Chemotaxis response regulator containing a CheY-like receiver domain and a methylesterase domain